MKKPEISRRDFLSRSLAGAASLAGAGLIPVAAEANRSALPTRDDKKRPNILLIVADDHGTDALGCYGNPLIKTPALDRLAADGVRFDSAFCTSASCSPSRSVILTGMHNHSTGQYGLQHEHHHFSTFDNIRSLPYYLATAGYRTGRIGKFHVAPEHVYHFNEVFYDGAANDSESLARSPVEMAERCRQFIRNDRQPFFLYFCVDDPHRGVPYNIGANPNKFGNKEKGYPGITPVPYSPADVIVPPFLPDIIEVRKELAEYYQSVSRLDQGVGRLIDELKSAGQYDNTLIIYLSDNGIAFPGAKTTLYESGMRVPCLVHLPGGLQRGTVSDAMISWCDVTPTILDLAAAVPKEHSFQGRSFRDVLEGRTTSGWDEVYASHTFHAVTMYYPMRVVRGRRYKLIWNLAYQQPFPMANDLYTALAWQGIMKSGQKAIGKRSVDAFLHRPEFELYDLERDPFEVENLADDSKHRAIFTEYRDKIRTFQKSTKDPWREVEL